MRPDSGAPRHVAARREAHDHRPPENPRQIRPRARESGNPAAVPQPAPMSEMIFEAREDEGIGGYGATALGHTIATPRAARGEGPGRVRDAVQCPSATTCPGRGPASSGATSGAPRCSRCESQPPALPGRTWAARGACGATSAGGKTARTSGGQPRSTARITSRCPTTSHGKLARRSSACSSPTPRITASRPRHDSLSSACKGPAKRAMGERLPASAKRGATQRPVVDRSHLPRWSDRVESAWLVHRPVRTAAGLRARMPGVRAVDLDATIAALGRFHATPAVQPFGP